MLQALILGFPDPVSMGLASGWLMAGHKIKGIWFPKRAVGSAAFARDRGWAKTAPGVSMHGICARLGIEPKPVAPLSRWSGAVDEMKALAPDIIVSLMFTDRIPPSVLGAFPGKVFNLHPSLLPAYRGADPIFKMLWDRNIDQHSGVSLHLVDDGFDTGALLAQAAVPFPPTRRVSVYLMELVKAGTPLLANVIADHLAGKLAAHPQKSGDYPQSKMKPKEARLSPSMMAAQVEWLSSTIPQLAPLRIEGQPDALRVAGFAQSLGPSTGKAIIAEADHIDMDFADERIRLQRLKL